MKPVKKYCDITGYEVSQIIYHNFKTNYIDKKTGLHYANFMIYQIISNLNRPIIQKYLILRNAMTFDIK